MSQKQQKKPTVSQNFLIYRLVKWSIVKPLFYSYFQGVVYGREKVPRQGSLIVVSNHASVFDPPLLASGIRRPVSFMAKQELFQMPLFKQLITTLGAYPVNRQGNDRTAIRNAIKSMDNGWVAGIFLDGTRSKNGKISNPKLGAALIAAKAKVPLLPLSLWGTEKILDPKMLMPQSAPITIRIGDLIPPPSSVKKEQLEAVTLKCAEAINSLHDLGR
jgi:1-acyl-sn-glycerol-3-phosphate acyltransferase